MFGALLVVTGLVGVAAGVIGSVRLHPELGRADDGTPLATYETRSTMIRVAAVVLAIVAALLTATTGALGRGLLLAPAVFALTLIIVVAAGEVLATPAVEAAQRQASLDVRAPRRYRPRPLGITLAAISVTLVGVLSLTMSTASPDDLGRPGRLLSWTCAPEADGTLRSGSAGPYPGVFYAVPALVALTAVLIIWAVASRVVSRRPSLAGDSRHESREELLRARSMCAITAAATVGVGATLAVLAGIAASAMHRVAVASRACDGPVGYGVGAWVLLLIAVAAGIVTGWALVRVLAPRVAGAPAADGPRLSELSA